MWSKMLPANRIAGLSSQAYPGPEMSGWHGTVSDGKTAMSDVKSSYVWHSCLACFCPVLKKFLFLKCIVLFNKNQCFL